MTMFQCLRIFVTFAFDGNIPHAVVCMKKALKQVIRVQKLVGLPPPHSNYLGIFRRFRRTFAEFITFGGVSAQEF